MEQSRHGEGVTSVKVHHQPGGASSFSLAHDDGTGQDDRWGNRANTTNTASTMAQQQQQSSIFAQAPVQQQPAQTLNSE